MKKFLLSLLLCAFSYAGAVAQSGSYELSAEANKKCTELTRSIANELRLNEMEYVKLKDINKEFFGKREELQKQHEGDATTLNDKLAALEKETTEKLEGMLTPLQLEKFGNMKMLNKDFMTASSHR